ncbi:MAG: LON peptidase substrate-binding domain-containing protein [Acidobacteria bacterium]|nr:LON peptidase substrate-binding domain-containing protein [Acidobacteriota bacterium]
MLPSTLPLFPLPSVVLFPNVFLPLHIFEPRYRQMVTDSLGGDRIIGMVLPQAAESEGEGRPATYDVGCAGLITHVERLADGRFNIILRGFEKFRIVGEEAPSSEVLYRRALVAPLGDELPEPDRLALRKERRRLEALLAPSDGDPAEATKLPAAMDDEDLVNTLAQYLQFDPLERQALLERVGALARCRSMIELLEMKALDRGPSGPVTLH